MKKIILTIFVSVLICGCQRKEETTIVLNEEIVEEKIDYIKICQDYFMNQKSEEEVYEHITNFDSPEITYFDEIPQYVYLVEEDVTSDEYVYAIFHTIDDGMLGPISVLLTKEGKIIGFGIRE